MVGDMGHMGGLINPRPWRGQYRAGFSNNGGSPKPRKRAPCQKNYILHHIFTSFSFFVRRPLSRQGRPTGIRETGSASSAPGAGVC